jgi:hypothetical protein
METDRTKLSQKYKNWLTAIARVFHDGDEDAAWEGVLKNSAEIEKQRADWEASQQTNERIRLHLKATRRGDQ